MTKHVVSKRMLIGLAVAALVAVPFGASAHDGWGHDDWHHRGWDRGDHGGWHRDHDGWRRGGYWSGGRWIAGAVVAGAVAGLVESAAPPPVYYAPPPTVVYRQPETVVYQSAPVVTQTVVYGSPYGAPRYDDDN